MAGYGRRALVSATAIRATGNGGRHVALPSPHTGCMSSACCGFLFLFPSVGASVSRNQNFGA